MTYIIEYEVCALLFLVIVLIRFFSVRRFPSFQNKLFGVLLVCSAGDVLLDVVGSITIMRAATLPPYVNYLINTTFYALQFILLPLVLAYLVALAGLFYSWRRHILPLLMVPAAGCLLILASNIFTKWIFFVDTSSGTGIYTRGPLFNLLYYCSIYYLFLIFGAAIGFPPSSATQPIYYDFLALLCCGSYTLRAVSLAQIPADRCSPLRRDADHVFYAAKPEIMLDLNSGVFNYMAMMAF